MTLFCIYVKNDEKKNGGNYLKAAILTNKVPAANLRRDYISAVTSFRRLSQISHPFRRILSKEQSASYFPVAQSSRRKFIPPDFVPLLSSVSPEKYALRTLSLQSPFQSLSPTLPDDLFDSVRCTVRLGSGASALRIAQMRQFREISLSPCALCSLVSILFARSMSLGPVGTRHHTPL